MSDGAQIRADTVGSGKAGSLEVKAHSMLLEGGVKDVRTGLFAEASPGSTGDAGELTVNVDYLTMRDGAAIGVSTFDAGRGGDLRVTADTMLLEGVGEGYPTGLFASAGPGSTGDAGELTVNVDYLTMRDGAVLRVSNFGPGRGGHLSITADTALLEGVGAHGDPTGLFAQATTSTSTGDAGDLAVNVNHLTMRDGAAIGVSTFGAERGGDLRVTADTMLLEGVGEGHPTGLFGQCGTGEHGGCG
jgi:hypothetical protein